MFIKHAYLVGRDITKTIKIVSNQSKLIRLNVFSNFLDPTI